jgi:ATP sulfurylase
MGTRPAPALRPATAAGLLWPIPVTLDVPEAVRAAVERDGRLALGDADGGVLHAQDVFRPDLRLEADGRPFYPPGG